MADSLLQQAIQSLQQFGFFDVMLPFLLVFSIVYGILEKAQIFGEKRHDINAVIAFAIGLMVIVTSQVLNLLTDFLPWVGLMVSVFLCFILLTVMFWGEAKNLWENKWIKFGGAIIVVSLLAIYWLNTFGIISLFQEEASQLPISVGDIASIVAIAIFFGFIYAVVKGGEKGGKGGKE